MSNLKRWPDDGAPADVEQLLSAGKLERPNHAGFQRALLAVGVTSVASTAANVAGAMSAGASSALGAGGKAAAQGLVGLIAKWSALGALSAGVVVAAVGGVQHFQTSHEAQPAASADAPVVVARRANGQSANAQLPDPQPPASSEATLPEATSSPSHTLRATPVLPSASGIAPFDRAMAQEIGLIDRARAALRAGNAAGTLQTVNEYNRRFPSGRFAPEALYLKMEACVNLGDRQGASLAARRIVGRYPQSPQVGRAKEVLGSSTSQQNP